MQELTRFPNNMLELHGKYYWNIYALYQYIKEALTLCAERKFPLRNRWVWTPGVWILDILHQDGTRWDAHGHIVIPTPGWRTRRIFQKRYHGMRYTG